METTTFFSRVVSLFKGKLVKGMIKSHKRSKKHRSKVEDEDGLPKLSRPTPKPYPEAETPVCEAVRRRVNRGMQTVRVAAEVESDGIVSWSANGKQEAKMRGLHGDGVCGNDQEQRTASSSMDSLPDDIILLLFSYLRDAKTIVRCAGVSKRFCRLVDEALGCAEELHFCNAPSGGIATTLAKATSVKWLNLTFLTVSLSSVEGCCRPGMNFSQLCNLCCAPSPSTFSSFSSSRTEAAAATPTRAPSLLRMRLQFRGPAVWLFYRAVAVRAMIYSKIAYQLGGPIGFFHMRVGCGAAPTLSAGCGAKQSELTWKYPTFGLPWIGAVTLTPAMMSSSERYMEALRELKTLFTPRLFKMICSHHFTISNRQPPPHVVFEMDFVHSMEAETDDESCNEEDTEESESEIKGVGLADQQGATEVLTSAEYDDRTTQSESADISHAVYEILEQCYENATSHSPWSELE